MYQYLKVFALSAALVIPVAVSAQDDHGDGRRNDQQNRRYEDRGHHDFHEWNPGEEQTYRRYLQENRMKYRDFAKANRREQNNYWNWRHSHPDEDRR